MNELKEYMRRKEEVERYQQELDRAEGALEQLLEELKRELDCSSVDKAKKKLALMTAERDKLNEEIKRELGQFRDMWEENSED